MSNLVLRSICPEDLDRVSEIESRIAGHPRKGFMEKRFAVAAEAPEGFITCAAVDGDRLAGYGFARLQEGEFGARGAVAVLDVIGVDTDARGRGIGKAVIAEIERGIKKKNIGTLRTQVDWANRGMVSFFSPRGSGWRLPDHRRDTSPLARIAK
jgi:ribosomal protein S18 acetylase RimI-like enzyme